MSKGGRIFLTAALTAIIIALAAISVCAGTVAYAESDIKIAEQPHDVTSVYGYGKFDLTAKLDSDVIAKYVWYKSERPDSVAVKVSEGTGAVPTTEVSKATDSGYYYCVITSLTYGGETYPAEIVSEKARVQIAQKPVRVTTDETELVYNGEWQTPKFTVNAEDLIEGDTVNARLETETTTKDAGTYVGTIKLDNPQYKVDGDAEATFTITKAELTVKIKEIGVRVGKDYSLEIEYEGFKGSDDASALGFTPEIPRRYYDIKVAGVYDVVCSGETESKNYVVKYAPSKLYVNDGTLGSNDIIGITATAGGSFRSGTRLEVRETETAVNGFHFLKRIRHIYEPEFVSGGADGETYTINIEDSGISRFMLSVCTVDDKGDTKRVNGFSYNDGVLSVTLPTDFDGGIVIYNDYTIITVVGAVLLLVLFITMIAVLSSKRKYKKQLFYYRAAEKEADRYRR